MTGRRDVDEPWWLDEDSWTQRSIAWVRARRRARSGAVRPPVTGPPVVEQRRPLLGRPGRMARSLVGVPIVLWYAVNLQGGFRWWHIGLALGVVVIGELYELARKRWSAWDKRRRGVSS